MGLGRRPATTPAAARAQALLAHRTGKLTTDLPRQSTPHHSSELTTDVAFLRKGNTFSATLVFTDLDEIQLGGLLAALQPSTLLGEEKVWQHTRRWEAVRVRRLHPHHRPFRQRRVAHRSPLRRFPPARRKSTWRRRLGQFRGMDGAGTAPRWSRPGRDSPRRSNPTPSKPTRSGIRRVTRRPPPRRRPRRSTPGFAFWQQTSGTEYQQKNGKRRGNPLMALPDLADDDQELPIMRQGRRVRSAQSATTSRQPAGEAGGDHLPRRGRGADPVAGRPEPRTCAADAAPRA